MKTQMTFNKLMETIIEERKAKRNTEIEYTTTDEVIKQCEHEFMLGAITMYKAVTKK
jgi:hypothetical protein